METVKHLWLGALLLSLLALWSGAIVAMVMWRAGGEYVPYLLIAALAAGFALYTYRMWKGSTKDDDAGE